MTIALALFALSMRPPTIWFLRSVTSSEVDAVFQKVGYGPAVRLRSFPTTSYLGNLSWDSYSDSLVYEIRTNKNLLRWKAKLVAGELLASKKSVLPLGYWYSPSGEYRIRFQRSGQRVKIFLKSIDGIDNLGFAKGTWDMDYTDGEPISVTWSPDEKHFSVSSLQTYLANDWTADEHASESWIYSTQGGEPIYAGRGHQIIWVSDETYVRNVDDNELDMNFNDGNPFGFIQSLTKKGKRFCQAAACGIDSTSFVGWRNVEGRFGDLAGKMTIRSLPSGALADSKYSIATGFRQDRENPTLAAVCKMIR